MTRPAPGPRQMIYFVVGTRGSFSIRIYLAEEGRALAHRLRILLYDELFRLKSLPRGTYVFTQCEQLAGPEREFVATVWERLETTQPRARLLNHPARVLSRHDLLSAAHAAGLNRFRAYPASRVAFGARRPETWAACDTVAATALRYPVFVRFANRHVGSLTPTLDSPNELERALATLMISRARLADLLVVEFCDTSDEQGIFRKYAAFKVGDRIMPRGLEASRDWMVKWKHRILDGERATEESCYLATNPHEGWIREVFRIAKVDYGRIDYGVLAGAPQVWEINDNPTIGRGPGPIDRSPELIAYKQSLSPGFESFYENFRQAWEALDSATDPPPVDLPMPESVRRAITRTGRRRERATRRRRLIAALLRPRWLRPVKRALKKALTVVVIARLRRRR